MLNLAVSGKPEGFDFLLGVVAQGLGVLAAAAGAFFPVRIRFAHIGTEENVVAVVAHVGYPGKIEPAV